MLKETTEAFDIMLAKDCVYLHYKVIWKNN